MKFSLWSTQIFFNTIQYNLYLESPVIFTPATQKFSPVSKYIISSHGFGSLRCCLLALKCLFPHGRLQFILVFYFMKKTVNVKERTKMQEEVVKASKVKQIKKLGR